MRMGMRVRGRQRKMRMEVSLKMDNIEKDERDGDN